jgi:hypothetical protein
MNRPSVARAAVGFASFAWVALSAGCMRKSAAGADVSAQESADTVEANASSAQDSHFSQLFAANVTSADPAAAADANAPSIPAFYPASCAKRTKMSATEVKITFTDCTGPFGLVKVNGALLATFTAGTGGAVHVTVASQDLTANGHAVTESGAGDVTVSGATRIVAWQGAWTRENAAGETVAHTSDLTITIDSAAQCASVDGTAKTSVASREIDAKITGYKICKLADGGNGCPWGSVDFTRVTTRRTFAVDFDGSSQAKVTGPNGGSIEVPLVCEAE